MVSNLITFRHSALSLVEGCFASKPEFAAAVNAAFEVFINKRENKPAEMMGASSPRLSPLSSPHTEAKMLIVMVLRTAKYLDATLRSGNRSLTDSQLESTLNDVLYLFRFTQGASSLLLSLPFSEL
jgi:cullin-4